MLAFQEDQKNPRIQNAPLILSELTFALTEVHGAAHNIAHIAGTVQNDRPAPSRKL